MKLADGCLKQGSVCYEEFEKLVVWQLEARYAVIDAALAVDNELERCFVSSYGLLNRCIITLRCIGGTVGCSNPTLLCQFVLLQMMRRYCIANNGGKLLVFFWLRLRCVDLSL